MQYGSRTVYIVDRIVSGLRADATGAWWTLHVVDSPDSSTFLCVKYCKPS